MDAKIMTLARECVARGWCEPDTSHLEMDSILAEAIARQVAPALAAAAERAEELERVRNELADLRERYRPRRQSEEPALKDKVVHVWDVRVNRWMAWPGERVPDDATWTHQPPAPEGE